MTAKFTPGPWHVLDFLEGDEGNLIADHYNSIVAGAGFTDDETDSVGFQISGCISRADANLIAVAPEMYVVLEEAREWFYDRTDIDDEGRPNKAMRLVAQIDAALAKANGGAA